jgi:hypothetical protein
MRGIFVKVLTVPVVVGHFLPGGIRHRFGRGGDCLAKRPGLFLPTVMSAAWAAGRSSGRRKNVLQPFPELSGGDPCEDSGMHALA